MAFSALIFDMVDSSQKQSKLDGSDVWPILHERSPADRVASAHFVGRNRHANLLPSQSQWCLLDDVWESRIVFDWKDRRIKVVSIDGLASMKRLSGRERDLLDLEELGLENDREENDRAVDDNATSQDEDG